MAVQCRSVDRLRIGRRGSACRRRTRVRSRPPRTTATASRSNNVVKSLYPPRPLSARGAKQARRALGRVRKRFREISIAKRRPPDPPDHSNPIRAVLQGVGRSRDAVRHAPAPARPGTTPACARPSRPGSGRSAAPSALARPAPSPSSPARSATPRTQDRRAARSGQSGTSTRTRAADAPPAARQPASPGQASSPPHRGGPQGREQRADEQAGPSASRPPRSAASAPRARAACRTSNLAPARAPPARASTPPGLQPAHRPASAAHAPPPAAPHAARSPSRDPAG